MSLSKITDIVTDKSQFDTIIDFSDFSLRFLEYIKDNLQAVIVSRNENHYRFFQYGKEGRFNITRPINSNLMMSHESLESQRSQFFSILNNIRDPSSRSRENRLLINHFIYTCQQSIGAALDALTKKESNKARKINGDLFERLVRLIIAELGVEVSDENTAFPVDVDGGTAFKIRYQHDLVIRVDDDIKAIGSVKTSSKDRIDKIFVDKFLYNRLTESDTPHFAVFLNDVQRKGAEGKFGVGATFLPGHFKGYSIKLNSLDGVYYVDIRPNMLTDSLLKAHIKTFDCFLLTDIWRFID